MKQLSKTFFNSVEDMNECYGIDAELPRGLHCDADLVCYEIVEPFVYDEICQYKFGEDGLKCFVLGRWCSNLSYANNEALLNNHDLDNYKGRCFVYVRVNEYLRKHLEKNLLGCEFVYRNNKADTPSRRFVHSVEDRTSGIVVIDQNGLSWYLSEQLFYTDDNSDPIPYKEWVNKINEQSVDG